MVKQNKPKKRKTSVAIDEELLAWVEDQIKKKRLANVSHAVELGLQTLKDQWEK